MMMMMMMVVVLVALFVLVAQPQSSHHSLFPRLAVHSYGTPQETSYSLEQSAAADDDANDDANDDNGCWTNADRHEKRKKDC
jgi:hypothetical protein